MSHVSADHPAAAMDSHTRTHDDDEPVRADASSLPALMSSSHPSPPAERADMHATASASPPAAVLSPSDSPDLATALERASSASDAHAASSPSPPPVPDVAPSASSLARADSSESDVDAQANTDLQPLSVRARGQSDPPDVDMPPEESPQPLRLEVETAERSQNHPAPPPTDVHAAAAASSAAIAAPLPMQSPARPKRPLAYTALPVPPQQQQHSAAGAVSAVPGSPSASVLASPQSSPAAPIASAVATPASAAAAAKNPKLRALADKAKGLKDGLKDKLSMRWSKFRAGKPSDPISAQLAAAGAGGDGAGSAHASSPPSASGTPPSGPLRPEDSAAFMGAMMQIDHSQLLLDGGGGADGSVDPAHFLLSSASPPSLAELAAQAPQPSPPPLSADEAAAEAKAAKLLRAELDRQAKIQAATEKAKLKESERRAKEERRETDRIEKERLKALAREQELAQRQAKALNTSMRAILERAALAKPVSGKPMEHAAGAPPTEQLQRTLSDPRAAAPSAGSQQQLEMGSIGSHVVHHDPSSPLPLSGTRVESFPDDLSAADDAAASPVLGWLHVHIVQGQHINGKLAPPGSSVVEAANSALAASSASSAAAASSSSSSASDGGRWAQKTSVELSFAGRTHKSPFVAGPNPRYDFSLDLPIFDVTTDVLIQCVLKHALKKNEVFAMCVVPLPMIIDAANLIRAGSNGKGRSGGGPNGSSSADAQQARRLSDEHGDTVDGRKQPSLLREGSEKEDSISGGRSRASSSAMSPPPSNTAASTTFAPARGSSSSQLLSSSSSSASAPPPAVVPPTPLSTLSSLYSSLFLPHRVFSFNHWLRLYPSSYDKIGSMFSARFPAAEDGMMQSGMERPKKDLGWIQVEMTLRMDRSLAFDYLQVDPRKYWIRADGAAPAVASSSATSAAAPTASGSSSAPALLSPPGAAASALIGSAHPSSLLQPSAALALHAALPPPLIQRPEEPLDFHKTVFKKNVRRLKRWLEVPLWFRVAMGLFDWTNPLLTFYALALWSYACFAMPAWQAPLLLLAALFSLQVWVWRWQLRLDQRALVHTYMEDALPYEHAGEGSWKKFKRYKGHLAKTSYTIGRVASVLEKGSNMINFTDVPLTCFTFIILLALAALLSLLLFIVPAHVCVWSMGAQLFVRGAIKTVRTHVETKHPRWALWQSQQQGVVMAAAVPQAGVLAVPAQVLLSMPAGSGSNLCPPTLAVAKPPSRKARMTAAVKTQCKHVAGALKRFVRFVRSLLRMLHYLYVRSPDYYEVAHRILCERAVQDELLTKGAAAGAPAGASGAASSLGVGGKTAATPMHSPQTAALPVQQAPSTANARRLLFGAHSMSPTTTNAAPGPASRQGSFSLGPSTTSLMQSPVRRTSEIDTSQSLLRIGGVSTASSASAAAPAAPASARPALVSAAPVSPSAPSRVSVSASASLSPLSVQRASLSHTHTHAPHDSTDDAADSSAHVAKVASRARSSSSSTLFAPQATPSARGSSRSDTPTSSASDSESDSDEAAASQTAVQAPTVIADVEARALAARAAARQRAAAAAQAAASKQDEQPPQWY